jgi:hypothetical protein
MTRVSIITTQRHNVGDDFVRDGIIHLLSRVLGPIAPKLIHKHLPITTRPEFSWLHSTRLDRQIDRLSPHLTLRITKRIDAMLPVVSWSDKVRTADVLVQSGAPIYWLNTEGDCTRTEWWGPLVERRWMARSNGRTFLNLGGGTCQHYDSDGSEFLGRPEVLEHIRRFFDLTDLTTVRDRLSLRVLAQAGRKGILLPCTSIFAVDRHGILPKPGEFIALNYMPAGGHFILGQPIDVELWESRFVELARRLARKDRVVIICHNAAEVAAANRLLPRFERFHSTDYRAYLETYSRARWGILNRVHGAFAMASLGKPAAVVGADSRARMASLLDLPEIFVNDASDEWLDAAAQTLESRIDSFPTQMAALKASAARDYEALLRGALTKANGAGGRADTAVKASSGPAATIPAATGVS